MGQQSPDPAPLRELRAEVRVRVRLVGIDSTMWFESDVTQDTEGCPLFLVRRISHVNGELRVLSSVPQNDHAMTTTRPLLEVQTRAASTDPWRGVDTTWVKRVLPPAECRR